MEETSYPNQEVARLGVGREGCILEQKLRMALLPGRTALRLGRIAPTLELNIEQQPRRGATQYTWRLQFPATDLECHPRQPGQAAREVVGDRYSPEARLGKRRVGRVKFYDLKNLCLTHSDEQRQRRSRSGQTVGIESNMRQHRDLSQHEKSTIVPGTRYQVPVLVLARLGGKNTFILRVPGTRYG